MGRVIKKMKYDKRNEYRLFTIEDVRRLIAQRYDRQKDGNGINRPLLIHKSNCDYGKAGCLFFALNGSPPKGYGLYVPNHRYLIIVDAFGKTTRYNDCILVDENDKYIDIELLPDLEKKEGGT